MGVSVFFSSLMLVYLIGVRLLKRIEELTLYLLQQRSETRLQQLKLEEKDNHILAIQRKYSSQENHICEIEKNLTKLK